MATDPEFSWKHLAGLFAPHRTRVVGVVVLVLASAAIGIVNPLLIRVVFDEALFPSDLPGPDVSLLVGLSIAELSGTAERLAHMRR